MSKTALVTGITGQDGAYLARLLLDKGYRVFGAHRRSASLNLWRLRELGIENEIELIPLDLLELSNILRVLTKVNPDEVYNLAAQSHVGMSFEQPIYTADVVALGTGRLLEALREINPKARFYQASSSEMYGKVKETPQTENTPFYPRSPYSVAKQFAHGITVNYRESYGMFTASGILFNHESPLRGIDFVTRKITAGLANIRAGYQKELKLGNLDAKRDWGFAADYVHGMWQMLQQEIADDYVLASGETYSVRKFVEVASEAMGFPLSFEGEGENTKAIDTKTGRTIVSIAKELYRPAEVDLLQGDPTKAKRQLKWEPKVNFVQLVQMMVESDVKRSEKGCITY